MAVMVKIPMVKMKDLNLDAYKVEFISKKEELNESKEEIVPLLNLQEVANLLESDPSLVFTRLEYDDKVDGESITDEEMCFSINGDGDFVWLLETCEGEFIETGLEMLKANDYYVVNDHKFEYKHQKCECEDCCKLSSTQAIEQIMNILSRVDLEIGTVSQAKALLYVKTVLSREVLSDDIAKMFLQNTQII